MGVCHSTVCYESLRFVDGAPVCREVSGLNPSGESPGWRVSNLWKKTGEEDILSEEQGVRSWDLTGVS